MRVRAQKWRNAMRKTCEVRISNKDNQLLLIAAALYESETGKHTSKADIAARILRMGLLQLAQERGWDLPEDLL